MKVNETAPQQPKTKIMHHIAKQLLTPISAQSNPSGPRWNAIALALVCMTALGSAAAESPDHSKNHGSRGAAPAAAASNPMNAAPAHMANPSSPRTAPAAPMAPA